MGMGLPNYDGYLGWGLPQWLSGEESTCNAGDTSLVPERTPGEGDGNPPHYSCLGNPMDRGAWQATAHGVARVRHHLVTKQHNRLSLSIMF